MNSTFNSYGSYSKESVMSRRTLCNQCLFALYPTPKILISFFEDRESGLLETISGEGFAEISEYLNSYSEKLLIFPVKSKTVVIVPSFYPSSALSLALCFDIEIDVFLRLVSECGADDIFQCSEKIKASSARMSKTVREKQKVFSQICEDIRHCFLRLNRLDFCLTHREQIEELASQCYALSCFTGCPLDTLEFREESEEMLELIDFPLFTAFVLTALMCARKKGSTRSARILLSAEFSSATVSVSIDGVQSVKTSEELLAWKYISYDKKMLFDISALDEKTVVRLNPCRAEWSLLGIKQVFED